MATTSDATVLQTLCDAIDAATHVIDGVGDYQLGDPTPCTEWDVRTLINHMTAAATMFAVAARHGVIPPEVASRLGGDVLGDDFRSAWKQASRQLPAAFDAPDVLDASLTLPFGEASGRGALGMAAMEVGIHTADLAVATGQSVVDEAPFTAVLDLTRASMTEEWRTPGILGPEQQPRAGAPAVEQLLAYAGRRL